MSPGAYRRVFLFHEERSRVYGIGRRSRIRPFSVCVHVPVVYVFRSRQYEEGLGDFVFLQIKDVTLGNERSVDSPYYRFGIPLQKEKTVVLFVLGFERRIARKDDRDARYRESEHDGTHDYRREGLAPFFRECCGEAPS